MDWTGAIAWHCAGLRPPARGIGCIEQFFRSLKERLLWVQHVTDVEDLPQALRTCMEIFNQQGLIVRRGDGVFIGGRRRVLPTQRHRCPYEHFFKLLLLFPNESP